MEDRVTVLGVRGSIPRSGADFQKYGGATTCVLVRLCGEVIVLDAGSGILSLAGALSAKESSVSLILTHPHADHLIGLPMCAKLFDPSFQLDFYAAPRRNLDAAAQLSCLMTPPLWPIGPEQLRARLRFHTTWTDFSIGAVRVSLLEGIHPGGVSVIKLSGDGKSLVFATDCTLTEGFRPRLQAFAQDCDLLMIDGQYAPEEWSTHCAFGHNTYPAAARFGRDCGAKQVRIIHHDPSRTDAVLDAFASDAASICPVCRFAYVGEEVFL